MSDILREYLVSLGFEIHEPSFRHFMDSINKSESLALRAGGAILGVAGAVELMVAKIAAQQEHLYFVAQRTGSSVQSLQAYEFGLTQVGVSADAARSSVEGFAMALRQNPGLAGLARSLGVTNLNDAVKGQHQLIGRLRQLPDFVGMQFAQMFGMDAQTFIQLKHNWETEEKFEKQFLKRQQDAGVGTRESSEAFRNFATTLRTLEGDFGILEQRIGQDWVVPATHVLELVDKMIVGFNNMDTTTRKLITTVFTLWGAFKGLGMVAGVARKFGLMGGAAGAAGAGAAGGRLATLSRFKKGAGIGVALGMLELSKATDQGAPWAVEAQDNARQMADYLFGTNLYEAGLREREGGGGSAGSAAANRLKTLSRFHQRLGPGIPIKSGAGESSPVTRKLMEILSDVDGIRRVTALNDAYHAGQGQHGAGNALDLSINDPSRSAEITAAIRAKLTAAGINANVINEYLNPSAHATAGHIHVAAPELAGALTGGGGGGNTVVQHNTASVTVHGAEAPQKTADRVKDALKNSNEQASRIAAGAIQ